MFPTEPSSRSYIYLGVPHFHLPRTMSSMPRPATGARQVIWSTRRFMALVDGYIGERQHTANPTISSWCRNGCRVHMLALLAPSGMEIRVAVHEVKP